MRIYNGTGAQIDVPLTPSQRLIIAPRQVSQEFLPNDRFIELMACCYTAEQIALVVNGPFEINMCSRVASVAPMVATSVDEAIRRFLGEETVVPEVVDTEEVKNETTEETVEETESTETEETTTAEVETETTVEEETTIPEPQETQVPEVAEEETTAPAPVKNFKKKGKK